MSDSSPTSGFITPLMSVNSSSEFTGITFLPTRGYNLLAKAKRGGRWWMLKGLKAPYRDQTIYKELLRKEYELLSGLGFHPLVVTAYSLEQVDDFSDDDDDDDASSSVSDAYNSAKSQVKDAYNDAKSQVKDAYDKAAEEVLGNNAAAKAAAKAYGKALDKAMEDVDDALDDW